MQDSIIDFVKVRCIMRRLGLVLAVLGLFVIADQANAQYRGWRGGGGRGSGWGIGVGTGGVYGGYSSGYRGYGYPGYYNGYGYGRGYYPGTYNSFYGGYGYGSGIGLWFSPTGYNYIPWSARSTLYSPTTTVVVPQDYVVPRVVDSTATTTSSNEWGLKVTKVMDGPAKKADLREGDVIMGVGQTRVQTFTELQRALASARGQVDLVFLNKDNQKMEKVQVTPDNGKLGIEVFPVDVQ
jgi:hypothetical protein